MPAQPQYSGLSDFFQTPAGRALMAMSAPPKPTAPDPGVDPRAAFAGGGRMRPMLANAVADAYGEDLLRTLDARKPTVFHREANPAFAGTAFGGARDEVYDPVQDAPIVAGERARREGMLNADSIMGLQEIFAPRTAELDQLAKDADAAGDSFRRWKYEVPFEDLAHARDMELADTKGTAALVQQLLKNQGQQAVAETRARKNPTEVVADLIANMSRSGAFGRDAKGRPLPPPAGVSDSLLQELNGLLFGTDGSTPPPPAPGSSPQSPAPAGAVTTPAGGGKRISRASLARAVADGHAPSIEAAEAEARANGFTVY